MRVLTYVDGILTVIRDDEFFRGEATKPSFIVDNFFYYEPTLQMSGNRQLKEEEIANAEVFIDTYVFSTQTPSPTALYHKVDEDGNYLGVSHNQEGLNVESAPMSENLKYYQGAWCECCLVDKDTKKYIGIGDTRTAENTEYAPNTIPQEPFALHYYSWDGTTWNITLEDAKECKKNRLFLKQKESLNALLGIVASEESASFKVQEEEARAWNIDNTVATPFLDGLFASRGMEETKQELVDKILIKADAYKTAYSTMLGKFQRIIKEVEVATSVEEVTALVWNYETA